MGEQTKIEWCDHTWNPWRGCTKVSAGCDHCYAETLAKRNPAALGEWGPEGRRAIGSEEYWRLPYRWDADARLAGRKASVFCLSLGDWLEDRPELVAHLVGLLEVIHRTENLVWLLLTKRPENFFERMRLAAHAAAPTEARQFIIDWHAGHAPAGVIVGASVENREQLERRRCALAQIPAAGHFLSCEPLLGPLPYVFDYPGVIDWVIAGGESGPGARPMHPDWPRSIRDQCQRAGVPFFFKQWGEWLPISQTPDGFSDEHARFEPPSVHHPEGRYSWPWATCSFCYDQATGQQGHTMYRLGKKAAGRLLDGREWNEFPELLAGSSSLIGSGGRA